MRLDRLFHVVAMPGNVMLFCRPSDRGAVVASCAAHLEPEGLLIAGFSLRHGDDELRLDEYDELAGAAGLSLVQRWATWDRDPFDASTADYAVSVHGLDAS